MLNQSLWNIQIFATFLKEFFRLDFQLEFMLCRSKDNSQTYLGM